MHSRLLSSAGAVALALVPLVTVGIMVAVGSPAVAEPPAWPRG